MNIPLESMFDTLRMYDAIAHTMFIAALSVLVFIAARAVNRRLSKRLGTR